MGLITLPFYDPVGLEVELRSELHNAGSLLLGGDAEIGIRLRDHFRHRILLKFRFRLLVPLGNEYSGWFKKLYAWARSCNFIPSLIVKFLNIARSESKNAGPYDAGSKVGPFWPTTVGAAKQFPLMN